MLSDYAVYTIRQLLLFDLWGLLLTTAKDCILYLAVKLNGPSLQRLSLPVTEVSESSFGVFTISDLLANTK